MKTKIYSIVAGLLLTASVFAQAPQKMTYQAVLRNSSDALVQSSPVGMKVSILQGSVTGTAVYVETHTTQTNQNGLLDIEIGGGTVVSGTYYNGIYWEGGPYFLKTEIDPSGGANYIITSTSELLSVPYSNYSHFSGALTGWATDYVGAYLDVSNPANIFPLMNVIITYLSFDKVQISINSVDFHGSIYGTVSGNSLVIPNSNLIYENNGTAENLIWGSGTRNGNNLNLTLTLGGIGTYTYSLVRQ
jgi:hypothetical protein